MSDYEVKDILRLLALGIAEDQACGHCDGTCSQCVEDASRLIESVRAEALREVADKFEQNPDGEWGVWQEYEGWSIYPTDPIREEADRIEREVGMK